MNIKGNITIFLIHIPPPVIIDEAKLIKGNCKFTEFNKKLR